MLDYLFYAILVILFVAIGPGLWLYEMNQDSKKYNDEDHAPRGKEEGMRKFYNRPLLMDEQGRWIRELTCDGYPLARGTYIELARIALRCMVSGDTYQEEGMPRPQTCDEYTSSVIRLFAKMDCYPI